MNSLTIIGKVKKDLVLTKIKDELDRKYYEVMVEVTRRYKNLKGEYEKDWIPCLIREDIVKTLKEIKVNDYIGIKGHIERYFGNDFTANYFAILNIIAEKVYMLTPSKDKESD